MITDCDIDSVGRRIHNTINEFIKVGALPDDPSEIYDEYESLAIRYLDAEHSDWPPGILEHYLQVFLFCVQKNLGISEIAG